MLHFVEDRDRPAELVAEYMAATGRYLALSHARRDGEPALVDAARVYDQTRSPNPMRLRSRSEIEALFGDLTVLDPGVVLLPRWRPELTDDDDSPQVDADYPGLAGVGRRD